MNHLSLSDDDSSPIQSHLDELSRRLTMVVILWLILTAIWSLSIDQILHTILTRLDPCAENCVNIFAPDEWAATRWLSAAIFGIFTTAPFLIVQVYGFLKPGLLPSERKSFIIWMVIMYCVTSFTLWWTTMEFLPWLYEIAHSSSEASGLVGRYDAAEMLRVTISLSWMMVLVLAAVSIVFIAGSAKLIWKGNAGWWRLRVHGMMVMLLWLIIPSTLPGLMVTLTVFAIMLVELAGIKFFNSALPSGHGLRDLLDADGGVNRILYVNCSCHDTTPSIKPLHGMGIIKFQNVCDDKSQQNHLLDIVKKFRVNKLVFSGCNIGELPFNLTQSFKFLAVEISSLDLAHLSTIRTDGDLVDMDLAMAGLVDPWSQKNSDEKLQQIIRHNELKTIHYGKQLPFGMHVVKGQAWIKNPSELLLQSLEEKGISIVHESQ